jgi:hypothetical protein
MIHRFQDKIINLKRVLYISEIKFRLDATLLVCGIDILFDTQKDATFFPIKNVNTKTWHLVSDGTIAYERYREEFLWGTKFKWEDFEEYLEFKRQVRLLIEAYYKTIPA